MHRYLIHRPSRYHCQGVQGRISWSSFDTTATVRSWAWSKTSAIRSRIRQNSHPMGKTRGKTTRESSKSGEKWRFFEGLKRHFALLGAEVAKAQAIHFRGFISVEPGWRDPPRFPRLGCMAPFSRIERGTNRRLCGRRARADPTRRAEGGCAKNATDELDLRETRRFRPTGGDAVALRFVPNGQRMKWWRRAGGRRGILRAYSSYVSI